MESQAPNETMQEEESIKPRNFFSRLGGVFFSPGETFKEIGRSPGMWMPILALLIISTLAGYYLSQKIDLGAMQSARFEKAIADGQMTQEQADQAMALTSKMTGISLIAGSGISNILLTLLIAGIFKLISVLVGAENRFKSLFVVTVYTVIAISIVQSILLIAVLSFKSPGDVSGTSMTSVLASNLGALIAALAGEDALPKFLMKLFGFVDIFAIWAIALLSIGYAAVSRKLKTSKAATWIVALYAIIAVIGAAIGSRS